MSNQNPPRGAAESRAAATTVDRTAAVLRTFWSAPDEARFDDQAIAVVAGCSRSLLQKLRLTGGGPEFLRMGRLVLYEKRAVVAWLALHQRCRSTSEYQAAEGLAA